MSGKEALAPTRPREIELDHEQILEAFKGAFKPLEGKVPTPKVIRTVQSLDEKLGMGLGNLPGEDKSRVLRRALFTAHQRGLIELEELPKSNTARKRTFVFPNSENQVSRLVMMFTTWEKVRREPKGSTLQWWDRIVEECRRFPEIFAFEETSALVEEQLEQPLWFNLTAEKLKEIISKTRESSQGKELDTVSTQSLPSSVNVGAIEAIYDAYILQGGYIPGDRPVNNQTALFLLSWVQKKLSQKGLNLGEFITRSKEEKQTATSSLEELKDQLKEYRLSQDTATLKEALCSLGFPPDEAGNYRLTLAQVKQLVRFLRENKPSSEPTQPEKDQDTPRATDLSLSSLTH